MSANGQIWDQLEPSQIYLLLNCQEKNDDNGSKLVLITLSGGSRPSFVITIAFKAENKYENLCCWPKIGNTFVDPKYIKNQLARTRN